jgi:glutamine synthetase adenylyltransferase
MPPGVIPAGDAALAENTAGASPFLRQLMLRDPGFAGRVFREDADGLLAQQLGPLKNVDPALSQAEVMAIFRQAKKRVALLCAVADLSGRWDVRQVTAALTDFADAAMGTATASPPPSPMTATGASPRSSSSMAASVCRTSPIPMPMAFSKSIQVLPDVLIG